MIQLGGIIEPNDGQCHLDKYGMYSEPLKQDYPSLGHISRVAKDHSINVIFAVTDLVTPVYKEFASKIPGSSIGTLDSNSQNIVTLIRDRYQVIAKRRHSVIGHHGGRFESGRRLRLRWRWRTRAAMESTSTTTQPAQDRWFKRTTNVTDSKSVPLSISSSA